MAEIIVYQGRGKSHIKYIKESAISIWRKNDYDETIWADCIRLALEEHITYLKQGTKIRIVDMQEPFTENEYYSG